MVFYQLSLTDDNNADDDDDDDDRFGIKYISPFILVDLVRYFAFFS